MKNLPAHRWLLLMHQLPPKPSHVRVRIWRQLLALGAAPLKPSVYVLPAGEQTLEDFQWARAQILDGGGEATVVEARMVDGLEDGELEELFRTAREADYGQLESEIREAMKATRAGAPSPLAKFRKRLEDLGRIDFFPGGGRARVEALLKRLEAKAAGPSKGRARAGGLADLRGRTWVTRKGIHVDRMACSWLIRRFIDPKAKLRFVDAKAYTPGAKDLRFDMFEGEFMHEGDLCSFEVLVRRACLKTPGLKAIADIVHDIDLKDSKFDRPETSGVDRLILGIALSNPRDEDRLAQATVLFDNLLAWFGRKG